MRCFILSSAVMLVTLALTAVTPTDAAAGPQTGPVVRPIIPFPTQPIPGFPMTNYYYRPLYGMRPPAASSLAAYGSTWRATAPYNLPRAYGMNYYLSTPGYAGNRGSATWTRSAGSGSAGGYYDLYVPAGYVAPK